MPDLVHRIFTATLILGMPGAGKTTLLASFAEYLWETFGKVLCLYSWDGGAIPTNVQKRMRQGLIRFWRARTRSGEGLQIETLYLATKGYWPRIINPESGETSPAVELVPPVTTLYHVRCPQGHALQQLPTRSSVVPTFCDTCRTLIPSAELQVSEDVHRTKGFEQVGGVAFDGLTSMTGVVMEFMDSQRGLGHIGGEKPAFGGVVTSGSVKLGGNNRADVGFGQTRGQAFVNNSLSIPHLVEGPVFTALSMEATDEGGLAIVGAKLPGRAATDEASAWFGNVSEVSRDADEQGKEHFALFLRPFTDGQGRRHLLKTSASPTGLPDKLVDPLDQPWSQVNLGRVFRLLDEDLREALADNDVKNAPGLQGTPSQFGERFQAFAPPAPAAPPVEIPPLAGAPLPAVVGNTPLPAVTGNGPQPPVMTRKRKSTAPETAAEASPAPPLETVAAGAKTGPPPPPGMKPPQPLSIAKE